MKASTVYQMIKGKADPLVVQLLMDIVAEVHELKRQQGENLAFIKELAHALKELSLAAGAQHQAVEVLARRAGVKVASSEEFLSEDLDNITGTGRFEQ